MICISIGLFATNSLQWKNEFGLPDLTNLLVAVLTFGTVYISYKAAKSAERSAALSEYQTVLLSSQHEYEISPILVPLGNEYVKESDSILHHYFIGGDTGQSSSNDGTMTYSIRNMGKGAAYYLKVWIEISNLNHSFENRNIYENNENSPFNPYTISYSTNENGEEILKVEDFHTDNTPSQSFNSILRTHHKNIEVIEPGETIELFVPVNIQTIILDAIRRDFFTPSNQGLDNKSQTKKIIFTLHCTYKNVMQIETDETSEIVYEFLNKDTNIKMTFTPEYSTTFNLKTGFVPKINPKNFNGL